MSRSPGTSCAGTESQATAPSVAHLRDLLGEFERKFPPKASALGEFAKNKELLREFQGIRHAWEKRQVYEAEDFNILRTMRLTTRELCHSDILAWLLDHRLTGFGTHAQGRLGFRLFLQALDLPRTFADSDYRVARELSGKKARLDIVIEAEGHFIIGIENKVGSQEILGFEDGEDQTDREWEDLRDRATKLRVPPSGIKALFLTPDNQRPRSPNFAVICWRQIADVFERFANKAKPAMVRLFAWHYAETLREDVVTETETQEKENE
jgi:hypothetical protein